MLSFYGDLPEMCKFNNLRSWTKNKCFLVFIFLIYMHKRSRILLSTGIKYTTTTQYDSYAKGVIELLLCNTYYNLKSSFEIDFMAKLF